MDLPPGGGHRGYAAMVDGSGLMVAWRRSHFQDLLAADCPDVGAGAILSMLVPVAFFVSLQRYFVRGLTAGSVKG